MDDLTIGIILIIIGLIFLIFRKPLARTAIKQQNKFWGFHFGESDIRNSEAMGEIFGVVFIVLGILFVFGIVHN